MTAVPVMERIRETTGRTPDLTYVHSGLWDLSRFVREDMTSGQNPEHDLSA
jgi:hypothetical protein